MIIRQTTGTDPWYKHNQFLFQILLPKERIAKQFLNRESREMDLNLSWAGTTDPNSFIVYEDDT